MKPITVFPEWQGRSLDDTLWLCRELLEDADFPTVKRWREAGWNSVSARTEWGGQELPVMVHAAASEIWNAGAAAFAPGKPDFHARATRALLLDGVDAQ